MGRLTLEAIKSRLYKINPNITILSETYINNYTKLKLRCNVDYHEWDATWDSLHQRKGCPKCSGRITEGITEVKSILYNINPNIEILSDKYVDTHSNLKCKCEICSHNWSASFNNLKRGSGCPKCAGNTVLNIDEIKNRLSRMNSNIEILSDEYINSDSKLRCRCLIDGYEWVTTWRYLSRGAGCHKCGGSLLLSIEELKDRIKYINPNVEILSDRYINTKLKLKCKCLIHEVEWMVSWGKLSQGQSCPTCGSLAKSKENHYRWNSELTDEEREYQRLDPQTPIWRTAIFEKHNYTCEICNVVGGVLNAHHKDGYHWCKERRFDITNGSCMCEDCHKEFHKIYGNKHNTEQQWIEFYELNKN